MYKRISIHGTFFLANHGRVLKLVRSSGSPLFTEPPNGFHWDLRANKRIELMKKDKNPESPAAHGSHHDHCLDYTYKDTLLNNKNNSILL